MSTVQTQGPEGFEVEDADFLQLAAATSNPLGFVPSDHRGHLTSWLTPELAVWRTGEVLRRVNVSVAPVSSVKYKRGRRDATAFVVGTRVKAVGAKRVGLWQVQQRLGGYSARSGGDRGQT